MQRSSGSIGNLAAALAKAQSELVNPEKSLVATICMDRRGGAEQTFRYAPLSSGLDIVRKILGQHEIATVQTTSIDQTAGMVNLTTVLAHSSGEWIASDWPVCAVSETATPHRMGAALTYARRYALFTLVGIAGEDDLDAPDPTAPTVPDSRPERPVITSNKMAAMNGGRGAGATSIRRTRRAPANIIKPVLDPDESAALRDQLLTDVDSLSSTDAAAMWAHRIMAAKTAWWQPMRGASKTRLRQKWQPSEVAKERRSKRNYRPLNRAKLACRQIPSRKSRAKCWFPTASTKAYSRYPSRADFVTRPTSNSWLSNPV